MLPTGLKINMVKILKAFIVSRGLGRNYSPRFKDWYIINRTDSKDT